MNTEFFHSQTFTPSTGSTPNANRGRSFARTFIVLSILNFIFATVLTPASEAVAQSSSSSTGAVTLPARNWQYYRVEIAAGSMKNRSTEITAQFLKGVAVSCRVDEINSVLFLKCEKGITIEHIKQTLNVLKLTLASYREEYTNRQPSIFN